MRKDGSSPGFLGKPPVQIPKAKPNEKYVLRSRGSANQEILVLGKVIWVDREKNVVKLQILDFGVSSLYSKNFFAEIPFEDFPEWIPA